MKTLTLRDIPPAMHARLRLLSARERRSLNSEVLVLLEEGLAQRSQQHMPAPSAPPPSRELQLAIWEELAGSWEDDRSTEEIVDDIRASRTLGREVSL